MSNQTNTARWATIDHADLEDAADGAEIKIVERAGQRVLLDKLRSHEAMPATWCLAAQLLPTDTMETLMEDAGYPYPMTVWQSVIAGEDYERPVLNWPSRAVHNIAINA